MVWSLGRGLDLDGFPSVKHPAGPAAANHQELQLVPESRELNGTDEDRAALDNAPACVCTPHHSSPRPPHREVPRSFTSTANSRDHSKKKAILRALTGSCPPAKQRHATAMAALLKGITTTQKRADPNQSVTASGTPGHVSGSTGQECHHILNGSAGNVPAQSRGSTPWRAQGMSAPRSQLRSLVAPSTGMTVEKLLGKRPTANPGEAPRTPADCTLPRTPCPKSQTPAVTPPPHVAACTTPLSGVNVRSGAAAATPCISTSTPVLMPNSSQRHASGTPASLMHSSRSTGFKPGHRQGLRMLPGNAAAQTPRHAAGDCVPQLPPVAVKTAEAHEQRTRAALFAGVSKQVCTMFGRGLPLHRHSTRLT